MQVTEKRNYMDIFYINCFSHSLYLSRVREIFHVSRVSWLNSTVYTIYSRNFIHLMETSKQKRSVDTHKAEKGKWDRMPRWCLDHWIHPLWFILWRHWGLRQRRPPPPHRFQLKPSKGGLEYKRLGQPDVVYPRSPGRRYIPGTKGVPSISILVVSRDITTYCVIAKIVHRLCINRVHPELRQKNPGPKDGTDRWSANNEYLIGTVQCYFFHRFTPLRRVQGLQCSAYDLYFIYKSDAFWGGFLSSAQRSELIFVYQCSCNLLYCLYISFNVNII